MKEDQVIEAVRKLYTLHRGIGIVGVLVVDEDGTIGVQADGGGDYDILSLGIQGKLKKGVKEIGEIKLSDLKDRVLDPKKPAK